MLSLSRASSAVSPTMTRQVSHESVTSKGVADLDFQTSEQDDSIGRTSIHENDDIETTSAVEFHVKDT